MMEFSVADFRRLMPEFQSVEKYPDSIILNWAKFATAMVNPRLWKRQTCMGISLYIAHEITLETQSISASAIGGTPGQQTGVLSSKSVGSVNASYDTSSTAEANAGWWNLTTYGKQFIRLARIFGAGAIQL